MQKPKVCHMNQLMKVCRYLNRTKDRKLVYSKSEDRKVRGFVDASFDTNVGNYSQGGETLFFGINSSAFYARSYKIKRLCESVAEAETDTALGLLRLAVWIKEVMSDMGMDGSHPTDVFEDNSATFVFAEGGGNHQATKHMRRRISSLKRYLELGVCVLVPVPSKFNVADMLSKQGDRESTEFHCDMLFNGPFTVIEAGKEDVGDHMVSGYLMPAHKVRGKRFHSK